MIRKARIIAELLKILANENRLMILCELMKGPKTVGALEGSITGITQSALSQHLKLMKAQGILTSSKSGQSVTYYLSDDRVEAVIAVLKQHYCVDGEEI